MEYQTLFKKKNRIFLPTNWSWS